MKKRVVKRPRPHELFRGVRALMNRGQMTMKDLASWLDRPYMTVKEWMTMGVSPSPHFHDDIVLRLKLLRDRIDQEGPEFLPSTRERSGEERAKHVRSLYRKARRGE